MLIGAAKMAVGVLPSSEPLLSIGISQFVLWNLVRTPRGS